MKYGPGELEDAVWRFLQEHGEMSTYALGSLSKRNSLRHVFKKFKTRGLIHVSRWMRHPVNKGWMPCYVAGQGKDAPKPPYYSPEETKKRDKQAYKRYRAKNKERLAEKRRKLPKDAPRGYVKVKIIELFKSGEEMTTKEATLKAGGDRSSAQRVIKALRKKLYISDWRWSGTRYVAAYSWKSYGDQDMPRPKKQSAVKIVNQWGWLYGAARA